MSETQNPSHESQPRRSWWTYAHMLAFGLLLALLMTLLYGVPGTRDQRSQVVFTEADVAQVRARHLRTWSRPPTEEELRRAFEQYVREEILYREALARNLDREDPTVRLTMVRKIMMMGTAQAEAAEPSEAELQAFYALRQERYRESAVVDLLQIYLSPDKRGAAAPDDAERLLTELREREPVESLVELGDPLMLSHRYEDMSEEDLDRTFGSGFGAKVAAQPLGRWEGPIESGYGLHLVKVTRRVDSRIPELLEVKSRLVRDMRFEARQGVEDQMYGEIVPRYDIVYGEGVAELLAGRVP